MKFLLVLVALIATIALASPSSLKWDKNEPQNQNVHAFGPAPACPKNCTAWCTDKYNRSYGICNRSIGMCSCALP